MKQCFTRTGADCRCTLSSFARYTWRASTKTAIAIIAAFLLFVTNTNAQSATALNFDGTNDYVAVNNPYRTFNKEITVEFWMNTPSANMPFGSVMGQGTSNVDNMTNNVWLMHPNINGTMTFYVNDAGTWRAAQCNIIAGSWHHYAGVASATSTKIYVDGALVFTGAGISNTILNNTSSVIHIGKDVRYNVGKPGDIPRYGNMSIDEVRIWNRALCKDEIVNNMNCQVNAQTGLQEVYHFNHGLVNSNNAGITTLTDASGNIGRDGTLNNFGLTGLTSNWVASGSTNTGTCAAFIAPTAPITGTTSICIGASTTLANSIAGGTWSSSNTAVATINATTGAVNSVSAGTSNITYTTDCGGVSTTTLSVYPIPVATIAAVGGTSTCPGNSITLNANTGTGFTYQWKKDGTDISGATNSSYAAALSGSYTVVITGNGCVSPASNAIVITVSDVTAPVINCPASQSVNNNTNVCGAVVTFSKPTATDNCSGSAFNFWNTGEPNDANPAHEDYLQLYNSGTWNDLPNANLNRSIVEFNSIISTVFANYSLIGTFGGHTYYISNGSASWTNSRTAAQAIGGDLASINTLAEDNFLAPYGGSTWVGGYQDHSDPSYAEPGNASQNFAGWKWVDGTKLGAGQITIIQIAGLASGSTFPIGVTTNTFKATDESGNSSTCSFTVTVKDVQPPVITCPANQTVTATSASGAVVNYTTPVGTDNCSGATTIRTAGLASGSTFPIGTTTVTHTVTDAAGLTASCSFTVKVSGLAPVIVCPANITVNNDPAQCSAIVSFAATETTGVPASTITYSKVPGSMFPVGTTTVTATATNAVGSSTCSFTVTVTAIDSDGDGIPDACDADADNDGIPNVLECNKSNFYWSNPPTVSGNTATGTINGIGYTYTSSSPIYTTTSMYAHSTFPLSYGVPNANPTIKNLAVTNNTITFASPMTNPVLVFASIGQGGVPVPITFGAPIEIVWSQNVVLNSPTRITGTEGYAIIRMMGTFSSINFNYLVAENWCNFAFGADFQTCGDKDNDGIPDYLDLDSDGDGCSDAIEGTMSFSVNQTSGGRLTGAVNSQGIPILAGSGQGVGTSQTYIVNCFCQPGLDETKPNAITKNITVNLDAGGNAAITASQVNDGSTDDCGIASMTVSTTNFTCSNIGVNTVTLTVTDNQGNVSSATAQVTVADNIKPVITSNGDKSVNNDPAKCGATVVVSATAKDNCGVNAPAGVRSDGKLLTDEYPVGTTTITWTVTDIHGNKNTTTQSVTVTDNEKPTISIAPVSANNDLGACSATVNIGTPITGDNCGIASVVNNHASNVYPVGTTTVTWTVTDIHGNTNTTTQSITVTDNEVPTITAPVNIAVNNTAGICEATVALGTPVTGDNCAVATVVNDHTSKVYPVGTTTVTWTVTDIHGNTNTTTQLVTVTDNEQPTISIAAVSVNNDIGVCSATVNIGIPTTGDNCGVAGVVNDHASSVYPVGTTTVTWTVTDLHGNTGSITQLITVTDNELPVITSPAAQVICANADGSTAYSIPAASATDNCGVASQSYAITGATTRGGTGYDASGVFNIGVSTIIWTVTDVHGNTSTGTTTVTINPLPVASYTTSNADAFCNQLTITASSSITPATYQWFSGSSTFANTQSISLGQTNGDGIYSVKVTDATTGCVSATAATYNFQKQTLASSYTILALEEVELGAYNKVNSGSVGVISAKGEAEFRSNSSVNSPGSFVKARKIESKGSNILITTPILSAATGITLPTMYYNTASTSGLSNKEVAKNSITTVSGNYKNLTLKKGSRTTLTGSVYGAIKVEQGAQVTFTQTTINIGKLHVVKGPRVGYSYVHFADGTKVLIGESVNIGSQVYMNPDNNNVTFYLSNKKKGDHDEEGDGKSFMIHGGDTRVTANIYMPGGKLKVKGGYGYGDYGKGKGDSDKEDDDEKDYGNGNSYVYMTGLFIAKEVESEGKNVIWNSFDCSSAPVPLVNTTTVAQSVSIEKVEMPTTEEELKVTVMPNPSATYFTIKLESKYEIPVNMRVLDAGGRVIDAKAKIGSNSTFQVGHGYSSGTYFAELIQGSRRKVVQLVKARG